MAEINAPVINVCFTLLLLFSIPHLAPMITLCISSLSSRLRLVAFSLIALCITAPLVSAQENKGDELLAKESLGGIKIGLSEKALDAILGKVAYKKDAVVFEEATGEHVQNWVCAEKGLSLHMSSGKNKKGAKHVAGFTATKKCELATIQGIKIGSTEAAVRKAYGKFEDKETSEAGTFVAGSVYGGIIFTLKDGKVSEIFFGAAAE